MLLLDYHNNNIKQQSMNREQFMTFLFTLLIVIQIKCDPPGMKLLVNFTGEYLSTLNLGKLNINDNITVKILVPEFTNTNAGIDLHQGTYQGPNKLFITLNANSTSIYKYTVNQTESYYIVNKYLYINRFFFQVKVNNIKIQGNPISQYSYSIGGHNNTIRYISILNPCTIYIDKTLFSNQFKNARAVKFASMSNSTTSYTISSVFSQQIKADEYKLSIVTQAIDKQINYSIPIYHKISNECKYQEIYYCQGQSNERCRIANNQTCSLDGTATCTLCGNNILNTGEDCDGTDHCTSSCRPETGYICFANNTCAIASKCGDGKLDSAEDCDSVPHCTSCKADVGYSCSNNTCYNCGNSILQVGQQCDNGNKPGCQSCKVVPPYKCKSVLSTSSVCFICGNSIYELGEECDNGNKAGCTNCTLDRGYRCKSKINAISNCTSICGDSILTADQQCDNGNTTGCINCLKDTNYNCTSLPLKPSRCFYCGNYIIEAGEQCDNNNKKGCINCKIQPGYNCRTDPRYCYLIKQNCGNGQRQILEQCDDGNKVNGDGCSNQCKTEIGYTCTLGLGEKSTCQLL